MFTDDHFAGFNFLNAPKAKTEEKKNICFGTAWILVIFSAQASEKVRARMTKRLNVLSSFTTFIKDEL